MLTRTITAALILSVLPAHAHAQYMSGVSGPKVKSGEKSIGYRLAYAPSDGRDSYAQRFYYRQSLTDRLQVRVGAIQSNGGGDLRFRSAQVDAHYLFLKDVSGFNSAIQVLGSIPDGNDGPGRARVSIATSYEPNSSWEFRCVLLAGKEIGDNADRGMLLETRWQGVREIGDNFGFGLELYDQYSTVSDYGGYNGPRHKLGPVVKGRLGSKAVYNFSTLFGLSESQADADIRLSVNYSL